MIKAKLSIDIKDLREKIFEKFGDQVAPLIQERIVTDSKDDIIRAFFESLQKNRVFQLLLSNDDLDPRNDLRGHLGLTSQLADAAANEIESIIADSLEFNNLDRKSLRKVIGRRGGKFAKVGEALSIGFSISFKRLENNVRNISSGSYISEPSGETIPWMHWLLDGGFVGDYRIAFADDEVIQRIQDYISPSTSRSGRAIMLRSNTEDWDIDQDTALRPGGKNFVLKVLEDPRWKEKVRKILLNRIENLGKNGLNIVVN